MQSPPNMRFKKLIFIMLFAGAATAAGILYYYQPHTLDILVYDTTRDRTQLLALFRKHWFWLVADDNYSPEYTFDYLSPDSDSPQCKGTLKVNVIRDNNQLIGFVAYYMKNANRGQLLFLAVDDLLWGKRYGQKLLEYGIYQLQCMGAHTIDLVTRVINTRAQKLYKRVGFKQIVNGSKEFVYFEYTV